MSHLSMQELSASLDGGLTGSALEQAVAHLATCHACRDRQARLVKHDDALRRLLAADPDDRLLDALARRSEELVAAVVRGLPVPPLATSAPLRDDEEEARQAREAQHREEERREEEKAREDVRRILDALAPPSPAATVPTEATAPPTAIAPPEPTASAQPTAIAPTKPTETAPPQPTASPSPAPENAAPPVAPLRREPPRTPERAGGSVALEPFFDELKLEPDDRAGTPAGKGETSAVVHDGDGYDTFNDRAYAGPQQREGPPPVSRAPELRAKPPAAAGPAPAPASGAAREGARLAGTPPAETPHGPRKPARPELRAEGFGVARKSQPAWARMGLEPDPLAPGMFREAGDPSTGDASVDRTRRSPYTPRPSRSIGPAVVGAVASVGVLTAVILVLRFTPAGSGFHLPRVEFGRGLEPAPVASTPTSQVRDASTRPAVEIEVKPTAPAGSAAPVPAPPTGGATSLCGRVVDAAGKPLAGVQLTVEGTTTSARSDDRGHFCLEAAAGAHFVRFQGPGGSPQRSTLEFAAGAPECRLVVR